MMMHPDHSTVFYRMPILRGFSSAGKWMDSGWLIAMAMLLSLGLYGLLHWAGIDLPRPLQAENWLWLFAAALGAASYGWLVKILIERPWLLIFFLISASRIFGFISHWGDLNGMHFPGRVASLLFLMPPCAILLFKHGRTLWQDLPFFRWLTAFTGITIIYYLFFNSPFIDPRGASVDYTSPSKDFLIIAFFVNAAVVAGYCGLKQSKNPTAVFDAFNRILLWYGLIEAVLIFMGYPFAQFSQYIDGFLRVEGTAKHPNHFAHQQATFLLYIFGLIGYYAYRPQSIGPKLSKPFLTLTTLLMGVTYLMALSKSSLAVFFAALLMYLFVLSICLQVKKPLIWTAVLVPVLLPLTLTAYDWATGGSFLEILQARIDNEGSFTWRLNMWGDLMNNIQGNSIWLGHGLSSSREMQFMLHNDVSKVISATSQVHNASIQLFYDMGFLGFVYYIAFLAYLQQLLRYWRVLQGVPSLKFLLIAACFMMFYFFTVAHFDESMFNYTYSSIFWVTLTVLLLYIDRQCNPYHAAQLEASR